MTKETELKLRLSPDSVSGLADYLDSVAQPQGHSTLKNSYLDTPAAGLAAAHAALRIRQHADGCEQTLKTRGQNLAGLQQRGEWNWPLAGPELDTALLTADDVSAVWPAGIDTSTLAEIFTTHFERRIWLWSNDSCTAEVVIDQGEVKSGKRTLPLCEVEIELKSGDAGGLWPIALQLAEQAALWLSDISKAERGYRLASMNKAINKAISKPAHEQPSVIASDDMATALPQLLQYEFLQLQRALEACLWDNDDTAASQVQAHWQALRGLPLLAGKVIKRRQTTALRAALAHWEEPLQRLTASAQLKQYILSADDADDIIEEQRAIKQMWQQIRLALRDDHRLAHALLQAATELFQLPALTPCGESVQHWLRHCLQQQSATLTRLQRERPQQAEHWRGRRHDIALLGQLLNYARALPQAAQGLNAGDSVNRVLADINGAQSLLQRPWPLLPDEALRSVDEYSGWALEHLSHLAKQL